MLDYFTFLNFGCWAICFWWMHRISERQNALLQQLHEQGRRIEELSKAEHELLREVHPSVEEIKASVQEVVDAVGDESPKRVAES